MTNIFASPEKVTMRTVLFESAVRALEADGWTVSRVPRSGKSSIRQITKGPVTKKVSIRTSQDTWIAFPRNETNDGWATLEDVDMVVASSVNDKENPKLVKVHLIEGDEMRARFDRAYTARKNAGYKMQEGRGIWISLYENEVKEPVNYVGAGVGNKVKPIGVYLIADGVVREGGADDEDEPVQVSTSEAPLTISEAKRRLATTLGVPESAISITING